MLRVHIDIESRSTVNLNAYGVYKYVEDPWTQIIVVCWCIDEGPIHTWHTLAGEKLPADLRMAILDPRSVFIAHNAEFEHTMLAVVGWRQQILDVETWTELAKSERWSCTANRAAQVGLPRALEKVAVALRLIHKKDTEGKEVMLTMCQPRGYDPGGRPVWVEDPASMTKLIAYCIADVEAERDADRALPELTPFEAQIAAVTSRINGRGIKVDKDLLNRMAGFATDVTQDLNKRVNVLSNFKVGKVSNPHAIRRWIKEDFQIDLDSLGKHIVTEAIDDPETNPIIREMLVLRRDGGKSSVAKLSAIHNRLNCDDYLRGAIVYRGAPSTGRFSSRGAQLQNLPRSRIVKNAMRIITAILTGLITPETLAKAFGPPLVVMSELIRPMFMADTGCWLARGDYSQIEARITAWLAKHVRRLDMFRAYDRGEGPDVYIVNFADVMGIDYHDVSKEGRQTGKALELAFGFLGGEGALLTAERIFGVKVPGEKKDIVDRWRQANAPIVEFGATLLRTAFECMRAPPGPVFGTEYRISFVRNENVLQMLLPSDNCITYWYPRIERKMMPWGEEGDAITYLKHPEFYGAFDVEQMRRQIWRGLLVENCLAGDTEVLTDNGWKLLNDVLLTDKVWDGLEWVRHEGLINKGVQGVIEFDGIKITPDHKVLTSGGMASCSTTTFAAASEAFRRSYQLPKEYVDSCKFSRVRSPLACSTLPSLPWLAKEDTVSKTLVYDLINTGPHHRFTIRNSQGIPILVSNCVQALARDIMAFAMINLENRGDAPCLTVHDEIVCQVLQSRFPTIELAAAEIRSVMTNLPDWAYGLPVAVEASANERYLKD
jgi:DNA polymerase